MFALRQPSLCFFLSFPLSLSSAVTHSSQYSWMWALAVNGLAFKSRRAQIDPASDWRPPLFFFYLRSERSVSLETRPLSLCCSSPLNNDHIGSQCGLASNTYKNYSKPSSLIYNGEHSGRTHRSIAVDRLTQLSRSCPRTQSAAFLSPFIRIVFVSLSLQWTASVDSIQWWAITVCRVAAEANCQDQTPNWQMNEKTAARRDRNSLLHLSSVPAFIHLKALILSAVLLPFGFCLELLLFFTAAVHSCWANASQFYEFNIKRPYMCCFISNVCVITEKTVCGWLEQ